MNDTVQALDNEVLALRREISTARDQLGLRRVFISDAILLTLWHKTQPNNPRYGTWDRNDARLIALVRKLRTGMSLDGRDKVICVAMAVALKRDDWVYDIKLNW